MRTSGRSPGMPDHDVLRDRSPLAVYAFSRYMRWYCSRNFRAVRVTRGGAPAVAPGRPVIVCSNHPSWWDPAIFILIMDMLMPHRTGFGPMEAAALRRYGLMRKMGVFGIDRDTKTGAADFLHTSLRILGNRDAVLWVTAQGEFTDARVRPVRLRPGISHLARRVPNAMVLPLALEYPFWNERRPEALIHFGAPIDAGTAHSVAEWTTILETALTRTIDDLAAMSMARNPALFDTLLRGRTGVGGVYDLWRHGAALMAGRRFDPGHEAEG
jgi:1-acyl-sn-glycerol-3-phosphate acyltransferase